LRVSTTIRHVSGRLSSQPSRASTPPSSSCGQSVVTSRRRGASNSRSTRRSTIPGRSCSTSGTRARTPSRPTGGRRTSRTSSSSRSCRSWTSVLGHVWNRCPPNFIERSFGETRRRGKVRKAEADVRPPVADGEAYRGQAVFRCASQTSRRGLLPPRWFRRRVGGSGRRRCAFLQWFPCLM
jgi:hypothetical protein